MRIGILTREYPPEVYGGAGVHVEYLTRELARHVDVRVHCFGEPRSSPLVAAAYQPWEALQGGRPEDAALAVMSVDLAMAGGLEGMDLVHSHTWYANLAGHLAKLVWDVPHVCTSHSLEPLRPWKAEQLGGGYALSLFCERTALLSAEAVIAVSDAMRQDLLACYPEVDPGRVHTIHNGIDARGYVPDHGEAALVRRGIDPGRPLIVFVGRIARQKGLDHLLRAAAQIDRAAQVVLIASAVGGIPEIVVDGETGYLVPCDPEAVASDPAAARHFEATLAERINQLIADPDLATRLGTAGRRRVLERFTWEQVALRTVEVYRQAIAAHAAGTG